MHTLISFLIIFVLILSYLILYHEIESMQILEVMHAAFTRQFIFELIPFIILFSVREMKFVDISSASEFFNSIIGRSVIGMIAFTFVTFSLAQPNINNPTSTPKSIDTTIDQNNSSKLNSFTSEINLNKNKKDDIIPYENYIRFATI